MNEHKAVTDKIYSLLNFKKQIDFRDPDYALIEKMLEPIPEHRLKNFYMMLSMNKEYFTKQGILIRSKLPDAISAYMEIVSSEVWKEHDVEKNSKMLAEKISAIYHAVKDMGEQAFEDYMNKVEPSRFKFKGENKSLFEEQELEVIELGGGLKGFVNKASMYSISELIELVTISYKNYVTKKFLQSAEVEEVQLLGGRIKLPEPNRM